ncbi:MAG: phosphate acyltransferase PlsX [Kiritimatiellia bacterium]|nr:phosphate acyltransferase PlsX [Kiritimatiellia bacterium]
MQIAIDAMGGDFAPHAIVAGALRAVASLPDIEMVILVGDEAVINRECRAFGNIPSRIEIFHASESIGMNESPVNAVRHKKDSSINRSIDLIKTGRAQAMISAGNTGAVVASATLKLRTLSGIERPAIATMMPTPSKPFVLIDAGANTDCAPKLLLQFAAMGHVYAREILSQPNPIIGLMSVGTEDSKGNENTKEAFRLLTASGLNFKGNIEGHDLFKGNIDVAVCDGFVGNVILKTSESVGHAVGTWIKSEFSSNPVRMLGAICLHGALNKMKRTMNPEMYGGAPLLGIKGTCIICHGASSERAIFNAIRVARDSVHQQINDMIIKTVGGLP